ncbi:hypothetical protein WR25_00296 [Diploscapter pachys]|uniref:RRM domain-containing protein n=1 Tax=Diploscapter pachys TaxID=2018661 RepID=A0A2A2LMW6_9BILA|nr:hypothetical protein WR25_00296 [Diploscapter pachys]
MFKPPQIPINSFERSARSVFVGNISYDVPEETIRQLFQTVGPVLSMKMVHDRETHKPKGYGFIEYGDIATAERAIRNLNGHELNGRQLRVDSAAGGDRSADEMQQLQQVLAPPAEENAYGPEPEPGKAPEAISRTVASLPPEKMFELMKQMRDAVRLNPNEVKNMLIQNPQLSYALLQAQVVMRIVDPQTAIAMLHRETPAMTTPFSQNAFSVSSMPGSSLHPSSFNHPPPHSSIGPSISRAPASAPVPEITPEEEANAQLLMQVMALSEREIAMLPPGDREKVRIKT